MKNKIRRIALGVGLLAVSILSVGADGRSFQGFSGPASREESPDKELSPAALKEDFHRLRFSLEEAHAGLYRYVPNEAMDKTFDALAAKLDRPMRVSIFYAEVLKIIGAIKDGHSRVRPSAALAAWLRERPAGPPISIYSEGQRVRVLWDGSGQAPSAVGAEVLTVNGRPIAEVVNTLVRYIPGDGDSQSGRRLALENPETFGTLFALAFGQPETYVIRVRDADGKERALEAAPLSGRDLALRRTSPSPSASGPIAALRFEGEVAVLTVRSFGAQTISASGVAYPDFLIQSFRTLQENKTRALIIDVRNNGGGRDEYGLMLYAHLAADPFYYYDRLQMNREQYEFLRWIERGNPDRPLAALRRDDQGRLVRTDHPNLGLKQPREPVFGGRVFILMNGRSFSATGEFMTAVFTHKRAVFVGEESGAGIAGNTSGIMFALTLPNSGLIVSIPMVGYYLAGDHGPHPERGLLPDHEVVPTVEDILAGRDPVLAFALDLARRS